MKVAASELFLTATLPPCRSERAGDGVYIDW
jgi:hypothetical protein